MVLTILAIVSRGTYSIATKLLSSRVVVTPITQSVLLTTIGGFLAIPLGFFVGGFSISNLSSVWFLVLCSVLAQAFGNILFFIGTKELDAGMTQIAFSSIVLWGMMFTYFFLRSSFTWVQLIGIILMMCAILLIQEKKKSLALNKGVISILGAAGLFSIFQVLSAKFSTQVSTGLYLLLSYFGSSLILICLYWSVLLKDGKKLVVQVKNTATYTVFAGGMSLLYFIFSYVSYRTAPDPGVVVLLLTSQVVLSVLFGIIFLKERDRMGRKIIAGILAFIASLLIKS